MEDYQHLADQLGINRSTAQTIVSIAMRQPRQHRGGTRGGRRNVKVDDDMRRVIEDILGGSPAITLRDLNAELRRRMPSMQASFNSRDNARHEGMNLTQWRHHLHFVSDISFSLLNIQV